MLRRTPWNASQAASPSWLFHAPSLSKAYIHKGWLQSRGSSKVFSEAGRKSDAYKLLKIPRSSSKARIRQAYLEQIKQFHPDVSMDEAANDVAVQLNAAYEELMQIGKSDSGKADSDDDIFNFPEAEPSCLFIDPFACNVDPMSWRAVQDAVHGAEDPISELAKSGVFAGESAVYYLSPGQLECIVRELEEMEETLAVEVTAWTLAYSLGRARTANKKF